MIANKIPPPPQGIAFMNGDVISQEWATWLQRVYQSILELQNVP